MLAENILREVPAWCTAEQTQIKSKLTRENMGHTKKNRSTPDELVATAPS